MKPLVVALPLFLLSAHPSVADEVYMIARDAEGTFIGSHKMFDSEKEEHKQVTLCGSDFWLRPYTAVWAKWEAQSGRKVTLEGNHEGRWDILCKNPTEQITLRQVGVYVSLKDAMLNAQNITTDRRNRFKAIRETFNERGFGSDNDDDKNTPRRVMPFDAE